MNQNSTANPVQDINHLVSEDAGNFSGIGTWSVNFNTGERFWSDQVYSIFDLEKNEVPDSQTILDFFTPESKGLLLSKMQALRTQGEAYDVQIQLETVKGIKKWVRSAAKPICGEDATISGAKGIFQDIDQFKLTEKQLEESLSLADNKNKQLSRFADTVSLNLSSHTENFSILLEALALSRSEEEQSVILYQLQRVAATLEKNLVHLKTQLKAEQAVHRFRSRIRFDDVYDNVIQTLALVIAETGTIIETDFSKVPEINYIPAYLESIFLNLLSNAIKFQPADQAPYIQVRTYFDRNKTFLEVKDNGLGIDLTGKDVFSLNSENESLTRGIGLFLIRNQITALGGSIAVQSKPNEGSSFVVEF